MQTLKVILIQSDMDLVWGSAEVAFSLAVISAA